MNVCLDEHRLGGLRWIVLRGPDLEVFRALGEHTRAEMAALADGSAMALGDLALLNFRGDLGLVTGGIGCSDLAWRRERSVIGHNCPATERAGISSAAGCTTLCTFVADLTAGEAVIAARDEEPVAIPLRDLAEGDPRTQRAFAVTR